MDDLTTRFLGQVLSSGRTDKTLNDILDVPIKHSMENLYPKHGLFQIFYDHVDCTTQESIDYAAGERLRKLRPDKAWDTIRKAAQYENEVNDAFTSKKEA
ncbi:hypothetical protein Tco_0246522 [Tanacetum coccineum]